MAAPDPVPVSPFGAGSAYIAGLDWSAEESAKAELFANGLLMRGEQQINRIRALAGSTSAYLNLLARTSAARKSPATHLDVQR